MQYIPTSSRQLISTVLFRTWILSGRLRDSEHKLTVLYGGGPKHLAYVRKLIFASEPDSVSLGRQPIWKLPKISKKFGVQITLTPECKSLLRFHQLENTFFIPSWVSGEISTTTDYSRQPWKRKLSGDLRRIRKYRYGSTVSRNPQDVEDYHHTMYRPLIEQSHGESALLMDVDTMLAKIRTGGELLLTLRDDEPVAGELIIYERNLARSRTLGIKDADPKLIKQGVAAASTFNTIRHVREKGFSRLDLGNSRAFLADGVLLHKKKWGLRLTGYHESGHILRILELSSAAKVFLERNPFVHVKDGTLWGTVFQDEEKRDPPELDTPASRLAVTGLQGMAMYTMGTSMESIAMPTATA